MIFVTVGTQLPFNRLTRAVDDWCERNGRGDAVFGQVGALGHGDHKPHSFDWVEKLAPEDFDQRVDRARLIVSHAGMGSIIAALSTGTPILILPRRARLGEQRSDHQVATASRFADRPGVWVATEASDVPDLIDILLAREQSSTTAPEPFADPSLIAAVRALVFAN